jgi:hypothetical protein
MNSGLRVLVLMLAALAVPVLVIPAQEQWPSPSGQLLSSLLYLLYVPLGAAAWSGGGSRGRSAIFVLGLCAIVGTAVDTTVHPTLHGYERNLWPLEIAFVAVAIWIPLLCGALLQRFAINRVRTPR